VKAESSSNLIKDRIKQVKVKGLDQQDVACERKSQAGSVSQRACVFCGSRVVLNPVTDALHLVYPSPTGSFRRI
jgi:nitrogenase molybdenum-cofactor synthesis protein NifE